MRSRMRGRETRQDYTRGASKKSRAVTSSRGVWLPPSLEAGADLLDVRLCAATACAKDEERSSARIVGLLSGILGRDAETTLEPDACSAEEADLRSEPAAISSVNCAAAESSVRETLEGRKEAG